VYKKYKDATHPAYVQAWQRQAKFLIKKAKKEFEFKLAKKITGQEIFFFAYARSKSRSKVKVGAIEDSQGELHSESKVKAEMLNDFFSTVFTREDAKSAPVLKPLCDAKLVDIEVSVDIIIKKLSSLKEDKAAGDD